jgi:hypothetical protein
MSGPCIIFWLLLLIMLGQTAAVTIELRGGSGMHEGNIFVDGKPVCDDNFDNNDAKVVCRLVHYLLNTK